MLTDDQRDQLEMVCSLDDQNKLDGQMLDIDIDVYHHPDCPGVSGTFLKKVRRSYAHAKTVSKKSPALSFGTMLHQLVLEPDLFNEKYDIGVKIPGKRKLFDKHVMKSGPIDLENLKELIDPEDWAQLHGMRDALMRNSYFAAILRDSVVEKSFFRKDPKTGVMLKYRPDMYNETLGLIVDLKTTIDASNTVFQKEIAKFQYDMSAALGIHVLNREANFIFAAVEKTEPYGVALYKAQQAVLDVGKLLLNDALEKYTAALENNQNKLYPAEIQEIGLPAYAFDLSTR